VISTFTDKDKGFELKYSVSLVTNAGPAELAKR
jgi:hypothetical protein